MSAGRKSVEKLNKINIKIGYPDKERLFLNIKKNS
jgi:predicted metalloendopeptidase